MVQGIQRGESAQCRSSTTSSTGVLPGKMTQPLAQRLDQQLLLQHGRHRTGILAGKRRASQAQKSASPIHIAAGVMQYLGEAGNLRHRLDASQHMLAQQGQ